MNQQNEAQKDHKEVHFRPPMKMVNSDELFEGRREVTIKHQEQYYRLTITKAGKLILNK